MTVKKSAQALLATLVQRGPEAKKAVNSFAEVDTAGKLVLFNNRICPFGHRAWWALKEKNVDYTYVHIDLGETKPAWYAKEVNPNGTVPFFLDDGKEVFESLICTEYLEDKYPKQGTSLLPKDAHERASIRYVIKTFEEAIPSLYTILKNTDPSKDAEIVSTIKAKFVKVNELFKAQSSGPYFLGDQFSMADLVIVTFLDRFRAILPYWRNLDVMSFPEASRLAMTYDACSSRPGFQETSQDPEFYIAFYSSYAKEERQVLSNM